eukprot:TRINITY_DN4049_c0_g1_i2.p1 TRINITY_DN4049_c0_g1~~TRINITY_DN4049_c0_g1_i2.p1  ORF type:complete len:525 (+),score=63.37 TRINITY_DN4049_c0_g1_i2:79-1575(+)
MCSCDESMRIQRNGDCKTHASRRKDSTREGTFAWRHGHYGRYKGCNELDCAQKQQLQLGGLPPRHSEPAKVKFASSDAVRPNRLMPPTADLLRPSRESSPIESMRPTRLSSPSGSTGRSDTAKPPTLNAPTDPARQATVISPPSYRPPPVHTMSNEVHLSRLPPSPSLPSRLPSPSMASQQGHEEQHPAFGRLSSAWVVVVTGVLVASLVANAVFYNQWPGAGGQDKDVSSHTIPSMGGVDSDGDGIPDQHDWCPHTGKGKKRKSSWISGRASDFDGDGCEDGEEDNDKDNDGVDDSMDRCPMSPQIYNFVSNDANDFDGDGCADGLEDHDDDGDGVSNLLDECRRTRPGDSSDVDGCSKRQREHHAESGTEAANVAAATASKTSSNPSEDAAEAAQDQRSVLQEWAGVLRNAWVEVLLGAALTPILHTLKQLLESLRGKVTSASPSGDKRSQKSSSTSSHGSSQKWLFLRCVIYAVFFGIVYACRSSMRRPGDPPIV